MSDSRNGTAGALGGSTGRQIHAHVTGWGRYVPSQVLSNADLERMVARVAHGAWLFEGADAPLEPDAPGEKASTVAVWRKLLSILERQALEAGREGGDVALAVYRRAVSNAGGLCKAFDTFQLGSEVGCH